MPLVSRINSALRGAFRRSPSRSELPSRDEVRNHFAVGAAADVLRRDLRLAARSLAKSPVFTGAATLALALGIGATTAMLSVVNGVLLRPLPYADSDRLMVILHQGRNPVAPANFRDWRAQTRSFTDVAAAEYWTPNLTGSEQPEQVNGLRLTAGMLPMLGVRPLLGRFFTEAEDTPGYEHVGVIAYGLWQRRFAGDPAIIGRRVSLDGQAFTIIGVMPAAFQFAPFWATHAELWAPLALGTRLASRDGNSLRVFARLRPGVTIDQARADLDAVTARLEREFPGTNRGVTIQSLKHKVVGDIRPALLVLLVAVGLVLLIACANVAHMLLARATTRQKEMAIRTALGASRRRLVTQLLGESALLAAIGGAGGIMLALWGVQALIAASPAIVPRVSSVTIDGRVLAMAIALTATTAMLFGLVPALRAANIDLGESFKDGDRASTEGRGRNRLRSALVVSEFALALVLLTGAGLMIRTFNALQQIDPGFDPHNLMAMKISTAGTAAADSNSRAPFYEAALDHVRAVPGVEAASYINHLPIDGDQWGWSFFVQGQPKPKPGDAPQAVYRVVFPGYFRAMHIPLLRGRDFTDADGARSVPVVIVNEFLARRHWPGQDAIGKRISFDDSVWVTVVGVTRNTTIAQWSAPAEPELFLPFAQSPYRTEAAGHFEYLTLVVRAQCTAGTRCDATRLSAPVVAAVRAVDRTVAISAVESMTHVVGGATAEPRFYLVLLTAFAGIALVLASVGIYGVMSYSVSRRTHEIGIRVALGAEPRLVLVFIVSEGMRIAFLGAGIGIVVALAATRLMRGLLYGVAPWDAATLTAVTAVLCAAALVATYIPARLATRIDPLDALRSD